LELGTIVGLDHLDTERQLLQHVVEEPDRRDLVALVIDAQHPDTGAIVNGGVLVVLATGVTHPSQELHIDLDSKPGLRLLVSFPTLLVALVSLRGREPVHTETFEYPPHPRRGDSDVVVSLEIHRDLVWPEVVILAQIHDLANHFWIGLVR